MSEMAKLIGGWGEVDVKATVYLTNGIKITSDAWELGEDGLLAYEGDGGYLTVVDPRFIVCAHVGDPIDADSGFKIT